MTSNKQWTTIESTSWLHVIPENDIAYHRLTAYCPCLPEAQLLEQGQKRILSHNAFDFRELIEQGVIVVDVLEPIPFVLPIAVDMERFTGLEQ